MNTYSREGYKISIMNNLNKSVDSRVLKGLQYWGIYRFQDVGSVITQPRDNKNNYGLMFDYFVIKGIDKVNKTVELELI